MANPNLLINGSFEDISLQPWEKITNVSLWPFDPHSGQAAIIIGLNPLADASLSQTVTLPQPSLTKKESSIFRLNFYALGSLINPAVFTSNLITYNDKGKVNRRFQLQFPQNRELNPSQYQSYTLETAPISPGSNLHRIEVKFSKSGGEGTILLDDVSLVEYRN